MQQIKIEIKNELSELHKMVEEFELFAEEVSLPLKVLFTMNLALEELITNVMFYGYNDKNHEAIELTISYDKENNTLFAELKDRAPKFNPIERERPKDLEGNIEERNIGGLGIHLVKQLMDDVVYRRENGYNILTIRCNTKD